MADLLDHLLSFQGRRGHLRLRHQLYPILFLPQGGTARVVLPPQIQGSREALRTRHQAVRCALSVCQEDQGELNEWIH